MKNIDAFNELACETLDALNSYIASNTEASFNNMPPLVFFYEYVDDHIHFSHQSQLSLNIVTQDVSKCYKLVREAIYTSKYEGFIVACRASRAMVSEVSQTKRIALYPTDNVVMFVFSKRLNDGVCLRFDLSTLEDGPSPIDASAFGNNLDLLISPQH